MSDSDLSTAVRDAVTGVRSATPLEQIERRGRAIRARRKGSALVGGLAAAGIAGTLAVSQLGGAIAPPARAALTAAMVKHVASASSAAMTSGQAHLDWISSGLPSVTQQISFDGANFNDVIDSSGGLPSSPSSGVSGITWTGPSIERVVDGRDFDFPALVSRPKPHFVAGWMLIDTAAQSLGIPDPRGLLSLLSPSAGFTSEGSVTVGGETVRHLHATTPGNVPVAPLGTIIQSEPDNAQVAALDVWVNSSDVVLKAQVTVSGTDTTSVLTPAGMQAVQHYLKQHGVSLDQVPTSPAALEVWADAVSKADNPSLAALLKQPGIVSTTSAPSSVTVTATFSQIGQPQNITAPTHYITLDSNK